VISHADFDDIFPWMARNESVGKKPDRGSDTSAEFCVARWEDDGGRVPKEGAARPSEIPPCDIRHVVLRERSAQLVQAVGHLAAGAEPKVAEVERAA